MIRHSKFALEQPAGSHSLAAAAHRERQATRDRCETIR